jgi:hypothetical protein
VQRPVGAAARQAGLTKQIGCLTFRHSFATELLRSGYDLRTVQEFFDSEIYRAMRPENVRKGGHAWHLGEKDLPGMIVEIDGRFYGFPKPIFNREPPRLKPHVERNHCAVDPRLHSLRSSF